ncbi:hypothetical protein [Nitrosomonas oligotropha]|uniref:hypothetical protein n=1 Tax=Nitrosomonas oligotropha TaxID=42354 RepID=UPI0015E7A9C9|nr:hypothetical protein [Nitrosomonas oligotropha]
MGQLILKLWIDPVQSMKKVIGEIAHCLCKYAHITHNPDQSNENEILEIYIEIRGLAASLSSSMALIPAYRITRFIFFLPSREALFEASKNMIGLANWMKYKDKTTFENVALSYQKVFKCLNIFIPDEEKLDENNLLRLINLKNKI